jgi:hypothetical protein
VFLRFLATNVAGSTKKGVASAMVFVMSCVGRLLVRAAPRNWAREMVNEGRAAMFHSV